jgi:hypothetical protein
MWITPLRLRFRFEISIDEWKKICKREIFSSRAQRYEMCHDYRVYDGMDLRENFSFADWRWVSFREK